MKNFLYNISILVVIILFGLVASSLPKIGAIILAVFSIEETNYNNNTAGIFFCLFGAFVALTIFMFLSNKIDNYSQTIERSRAISSIVVTFLGVLGIAACIFLFGKYNFLLVFLQIIVQGVILIICHFYWKNQDLLNNNKVLNRPEMKINVLNSGNSMRGQKITKKIGLPLVISLIVFGLVGWFFKVPNSEVAAELAQKSSMWKKELALQQYKNQVYFFGDYFLFNTEYAVVASIITFCVAYYLNKNKILLS